MSISQNLRRKLLVSWAAVEKSLTAFAEQVSRHIDGIRMDYQLREYERKMERICEKTGKYFHAQHRLGVTPRDLLAQDGVSDAVSEYKSQDTERRLLEQKRFLMNEEEAASYWFEFIDSATREGMTVERITLPLSFTSTLLENLAVPDGVQVISVVRKNRFVQPIGKIELKSGDQLVILGPTSQIILLIQRYSIALNSAR